MRYLSNQFIRDSIREILLRGISGQILQRQYRHGANLLQAPILLPTQRQHDDPDAGKNQQGRKCEVSGAV